MSTRFGLTLLNANDYTKVQEPFSQIPIVFQSIACTRSLSSHALAWALSLHPGRAGIRRICSLSFLIRFLFPSLACYTTYIFSSDICRLRGFQLCVSKVYLNVHLHRMRARITFPSGDKHEKKFRRKSSQLHLAKSCVVGVQPIKKIPHNAHCVSTTFLMRASEFKKIQSMT